jgi:hypothetical protein
MVHASESTVFHLLRAGSLLLPARLPRGVGGVDAGAGAVAWKPNTIWCNDLTHFRLSRSAEPAAWNRTFNIRDYLQPAPAPVYRRRFSS